MNVNPNVMLINKEGKMQILDDAKVSKLKQIIMSELAYLSPELKLNHLQVKSFT